MRDGLLELAATITVWISFAVPELMPERLMVTGGEFSAMRRSPIGSSVGGSFTGLTVRTNESLTKLVPSLTVKVMVVAPARVAAGVAISVRFESVPPSASDVLGTRFGFEELAVTIRLLAGVSASPMVNGIAEVGVSSRVA